MFLDRSYQYWNRNNSLITEREKRLHFTSVKMLNQNNLFMWYNQRLLKTKNSFVNNVHQHLSVGLNFHRELLQKRSFINNSVPRKNVVIRFCSLCKTSCLQKRSFCNALSEHQANAKSFAKRSFTFQRLSYLYPTNVDKMSFLSSDLANLTLSLKTYIFLKQKGIHKIGDLVGYSQKSLLHLLNRNREMFVETKTYLLTKS